MTIIKLRMSIETDAGHELQVFKVCVEGGDVSVDTETEGDLLSGLDKTQEIIDYIRDNLHNAVEDEDYED